MPANSSGLVLLQTSGTSQILTNMTADEFAKAIRCGQCRMRVTRLVLLAEGERAYGKGILELDNGRMSLTFEPTRNSRFPQPQRDVWKAADCWRLSGVIENDLRFKSRSVTPRGHSDSFDSGKWRSVHHFDVGEVDLAATGFDAVAHQQRTKALGTTNTGRGRPRVEFLAILPGVEPTLLNAGTKTTARNDFLGRRDGSKLDTFIDRGRDYDFAIIGEAGDLVVHLQAKPGYHLVGEGMDLVGVKYRPPGSGTSYYSLRGLGLQAWEVTKERWQTIADELRSGQPLKLGRPAGDLLIYREQDNASYTRKATFLFITREGNPGILRVVGQVINPNDPETARPLPAGSNDVDEVIPKRYGIPSTSFEANPEQDLEHCERFPSVKIEYRFFNDEQGV